MPTAFNSTEITQIPVSIILDTVDQYIPFQSPLQIGLSWVLGLLTLFGFLGNILVAFSFLNLSIKWTTAHIYTFGICLVDILICFLQFLLTSTLLSSKGWQGGFLCIATGATFGTFFTANLLNILWLTAERYFVIVREKQFEKSTAYISIIANFAIAFAIHGMPALLPNRAENYSLSPLLQMCTLSWPHTVLIPFNVISAITLIIPSLALVYAYCRIHAKIYDVRFRVRQILGRQSPLTSKSVEEGTMVKREPDAVLLAVLKQSTTLCVIAYLSFVPFIVDILLTTSRQKPLPWTFDALACFLCFTQSWMNPVVLFMFNGQLMRSGKALLGFKS